MSPRTPAPIDPAPLLAQTWRQLAGRSGGLDDADRGRLAATTTELGRSAPPAGAARTLAAYLRAAHQQPAGGQARATQSAEEPDVGTAVAALLAPGPAVVATAAGPVTREVYLQFRLVQAAASGRDGADLLVPDRATLRLCVRVLARALAEIAPGRSVELRVPPHVAVQCVEGPRHTRGTPPNVVEVDPVAFLELATGRRSWTDCVTSGLLRASGERADLQPWLPLLGR